MEKIHYSDDKKYATFNGMKFRISREGYYRATTIFNRNNQNTSQLHRAVWSFYKGDIPVGNYVHHIDENKDNNDISNLTTLTPQEHSIKHKRRSEENAKEYLCEHCGKVFVTSAYLRKDKKRFCSFGCYRNYRNAEKTFSLKNKQCKHCGSSFVAMKTNQLYCCEKCCQKEQYARSYIKKTIKRYGGYSL